MTLDLKSSAILINAANSTHIDQYAMFQLEVDSGGVSTEDMVVTLII